MKTNTNLQRISKNKMIFTKFRRKNLHFSEKSNRNTCKTIRNNIHSHEEVMYNFRKCTCIHLKVHSSHKIFSQKSL